MPAACMQAWKGQVKMPTHVDLVASHARPGSSLSPAGMATPLGKHGGGISAQRPQRGIMVGRPSMQSFTHVTHGRSAQQQSGDSLTVGAAGYMMEMVSEGCVCVCLQSVRISSDVLQWQRSS